jgi:hypothetical protein
MRCMAEVMVVTRPHGEAETPQKVKRGGFGGGERGVKDWRGKPEGGDGFGGGYQEGRRLEARGHRPGN